MSETTDHGMRYNDETGAHECTCGSRATPSGHGTETGAYHYRCVETGAPLGYSGL